LSPDPWSFLCRSGGAAVVARQFRGALRIPDAPHISGRLLPHQATRTDIRRASAVAAVGFVIIAFVLANADVHAKVGGLVWLTIGGAILIALRLEGRSTELKLEA